MASLQHSVWDCESWNRFLGLSPVVLENILRDTKGLLNQKCLFLVSFDDQPNLINIAREFKKYILCAYCFIARIGCKKNALFLNNAWKYYVIFLFVCFRRMVYGGGNK